MASPLAFRLTETGPSDGAALLVEELRNEVELFRADTFKTLCCCPVDKAASFKIRSVSAIRSSRDEVLTELQTTVSNRF